MIKETGITVITRIILLLSGVLSSIIIARLLGPEGKGILTVIITSIGLLALGGNLGIGGANVYLLGQKRYELTTLFWNSVISGLIMGLVLIGVAKLLYWGVPHIFQGINERLIMLYAFSLPFALRL